MSRARNILRAAGGALALLAALVGSYLITWGVAKAALQICLFIIRRIQ